MKWFALLLMGWWWCVPGPAQAQDAPVRAAVLSDFPPLYQLDERGRPEGFAIDVLTAVSAEAGLEVEYVVVDNWAQGMEAVRSGRADLIPGIGISPARRAEFAFSHEMETIPIAFFVVSHNETINAIDDLEAAGVIAGVIAQSAAHTHLARERPAVRLETFSAIDAAVMGLLAGHIDVFVFPQPVLEKKLRDLALSHRVKTIGPPLRELKRGYLLRKGDPLLARLDPAIRSFTRSSAYLEAYQRWYGKPKPFWTTGRVIWLMGIAMLVLALGLGAWRTYSVARLNHRLRQSEERFRALIEQAGDALFLSTVDGRIVGVNKEACDSLGYTREELLRLTVPELDESFDIQAAQAFWATLSPGQPAALESVHRRKDGTTLPVEIRASVIELDGKPAILGLARDVTARRAAEEERASLEEQLRQAQKMEALGQLAGGVAHDFNNLLQVINGYADLVAIELSADSQLEPMIDEISSAGRRATRLVGQLLAFSRRQILRAERLNLNDVVADLLKMLTRVIGEHIQLTFSSGGRELLVKVDRGMMEQVLMNLCVNARDAMPEGGQITIETRSAHPDEAWFARHSHARPGEHVVLSIRDTGKGMPPEIRDHIFEPFFTTKEVGKGTGLGLATVYGIVRQHDAIIEVDSSPGQGTTFEVFLPACSGEVTAQDDDGREQAPGGAETILLAEDDESVRELGRRLLTGAGYEVLLAEDGEAAVRLFENHRDEIDLLLFDVVMPKLGGPAACARIHQRAPDVPVLYASGYSDGAFGGFQLDEQTRLVQKPFRRHELLKEVRAALEDT